jgi:ATP-dependent helicase Lhr and Lhr-like helicase
MPDDTLDIFHPLVAKWFREQVGTPTDVQAQAWPVIAGGEHVLITAPTGSGKTLTAFLWAINRLVTGAVPTGHTSVLYVSPLKALNNDIRRNLMRPLRELERVFEEAGEAFPAIQAATRSGDTPQNERRRMQRRPPEILITTPESLNILLSSKGGRQVLTSLSSVILDEIHAVFGNKRGTHLITAVERLVPMSGEFQRVGLSATINPIETVAAFVGGYQLETGPRFEPRPVRIVRSTTKKRYEVSVAFVDQPDGLGDAATVWEPMVTQFKERISRNRSTLLFTNNRRLSETLTRQINDEMGATLAYAHHGSLSREIREEVERRLKQGELRAIVATSSLEMGIDIGELDEVLLVQSPMSISSAVQRVGRAGHQVGEVSRGTFFPTHSHDILDAAVIAPAILTQDIESIRPIIGPLDVLAQILVSMVAAEKWDIDVLFDHVRTSYPYRDLSRKHFDLVLSMLAGRYRDARVRELKARVSVDRLENTVQTRPGAVHAIYMNGGVIPDRGYFQMRRQGSRSLIGELDEEFVWESKVGKTFTFGTQMWKITDITHNDVIVEPAGPDSGIAPFYKGEGMDRDFHFSTRIAEFLEEANDRLDDPEFPKALETERCLEPKAAVQLMNLLRRQVSATGTDLPHRHHVLIEASESGPDDTPGHQVILHTMWGTTLNRPFGLALEAALAERFGIEMEVYVHNNCIVVVLPEMIEIQTLLSLVTPGNLEALLRKRLEHSGFFGARFRECAGRALLIERRRMGERLPLWMSRLKSQKLLSTVMNYPDFPILLEAWRTCLQDSFDLERLGTLLTELAAGSIQWSEAHTSTPSPFAQVLAWRQINSYMYMDDALKSGKTSQLSGDLIRELVFAPGLRPAIPQHLCERFERKRQRLWEGYAPQSHDDLLDWLKERLLIPEAEWNAMLAAVARDHELDREEVASAIREKVAWIRPVGAQEPLMVALEELPRVAFGLYDGGSRIAEAPEIAAFEPEEDQEPDAVFDAVLGQWLQYYGPRSIGFVQATLGVDAVRLARALTDLGEAQQVVVGELIEGRSDELVCDSENLESLLRMKRADAVPVFEALEIGWLPVFLAQMQGLLDPAEDVDAISPRVEQLVCYPTAAGAWETDILPARSGRYSAAWVDQIIQEDELRWVGTGKSEIALCYGEDLDLLPAFRTGEASGASCVVGRGSGEGGGVPSPGSPVPSRVGAAKQRVEEPNATADGKGEPVDEIAELFVDPSARYDFLTLLKQSERSASWLADRLWEGVWQGRVTNDTFAALRKGVETGFKAPKKVPDQVGRRTGRRGGFKRWKAASPFAGSWFLLPEADPVDDVLEREEQVKERVRVLLGRNGILFRELIQREAPDFQWSRVFRSLRLMELSGEVVTGQFFEGIPGPQFMSHEAFRRVQAELPDDRVYWMVATDPASLCGVSVDALRGTLPRRVPSTHLVYQGRDLVMVSQRSGKELTFNALPDDARLSEHLIALRHLMYRTFQPVRSITVETINGEDAGESGYIEALREWFEVRKDHKQIKLHRKLQ